MPALLLAALLSPALADDALPRPVAAIHDAATAEEVLQAIEALTARQARRYDAEIERALRRQALGHHTAGRQQRGTPAAAAHMADAEVLYRAWMARFGDHDSAYEMHYAFGELLYVSKRYGEAFEQYGHVVAIDPAGEHSRFCAESAIFAAEEMVKRDPDPPGAPDSITPITLSTWEEHYLDAVLRYVALYPDDPKTRTLRYRHAYLLFHHNRFTEAAAIFQAIIAADPSSREAVHAVNLILDGLILQEEWQAALDFTEAALMQEALGSETFKAELAEVRERLEQRLAEEESR